MSKYELQKLFFKKSKKLLMTSFFRSRSWSRTLPVSKPKLRLRPVLVSEKFCGLGLGLGRVGLDYSPGSLRLTYNIFLKFYLSNANGLKVLSFEGHFQDPSERGIAKFCHTLYFYYLFNLNVSSV